MLTAQVIGHIGGDAVTKGENGREFTTFRVAHSERWTGQDGVQHEQTQWVDVILNGQPAVKQYLVKGQLVCVEGALSSRIYSSAKDRCMKAGLTINARQIELLGGRAESVPSVLYLPETGEEVAVKKCYNAPSLVRDNKQPENLEVTSRSGERFNVDRNGWVSPISTQQ